MAERKIGIRAASEYTGFTTNQISYAAKTRRLAGYKSSDFGPWFFAPSDLDGWVESMSNTPTPKKRRAAARVR
ncbi:MAG: hypothetical protein NTV51_24550 [Verrucomicrobia bacterium]|nr:hypothetical protein [Verrucomicrobiota bacterium]